jgi:Putative phage tail protein
MDQIGFIDVPEIVAEGTFPLISDFGYGYAVTPEIVTHQFFSANAKITQRFYLGDGRKRYIFLRRDLDHQEWQQLRDFWEARAGPYQPFVYNAPSDDGQSTTEVTVAFEVAPLTFEHMAAAIASTSLTFVEIPDPEAAPHYAVTSTSTRIPSNTLSAALTSQVQEVIPLIKIDVREPGYPDLLLSDRRVQIAGELYLPRLLRWDGITQGMNGESDEATFVFGNVDRVMRDVSFQTDLKYARVDFSLYHVGTGILLNLWTGRAMTWEYDEGPEFALRASDFLHELSLVYPPRVISHQCWKNFNDDLTCPYAAHGTPGFTTCPRSWPDCQARGMENWFGGIEIKPQRVRLKDNSTGTWGLGRQLLSPLSLVNEGANGQVLQEIFTDREMPVNCMIVANRDESEFRECLGIVGAGPITAYTRDNLKHRLDGQPAHGPLPLGLRRAYGHDPVQNMDPDGGSNQFGLSQVDPGNPDGSIYPNASKAAGVAFLEIRRVSKEGIQLTQISEHEMQTWVQSGMAGFIWDAEGIRRENILLTNPIWIAVNCILRATGLNLGTAAEQEALIDIPSAIDVSGICELEVNKSDAVPGLTGTEKQFTFRGVIADQRALRDWLNDILRCCLGYYVQSSGKVKFGIRVNSSSVAAFTEGNVIANSIRISARAPEFNSVTVTYGDMDYEWQPRAYTIDDFTHQRLIGTTYPQKLNSAMNLVGCSTIAQAGRIAITRLREELGGIDAAEWRKACTVGFATTILGLDCEVGQVVSLTHPNAPGGRAEFRIERWTLNSDWSIRLEGRSTTDSMYDLVRGPKPADVTPSPVPTERHWETLPAQPWFPYLEQPNADDPLYDETDWNFGLQQVYETAADGTALAKLVVTGLYPITEPLAGEGPRIGTYGISATGGSIASGRHVVVAVTAIDAAGNETQASQPAAIPVDVGTDTNLVMLGDITWPEGTTGYRLYAGADHNQLSLQAESFEAQPISLEVMAYPNARTKGLPRPDLDALIVRVKVSEHAGVVGVDITEVLAGGLRVADIGWIDEEWTGRVVSVITDRSDGSAQLWHFRITSNNNDTLYCTPDPQALGVEALDTLIIRTKATTYSELTIGDAKFQNSQYPSGANPGEEVGRVVRIIAGTGAGQERRISGNDQTIITVDSPWRIVPDETSIFVVERAAWEYAASVGRLGNEIIDGRITFSVPIDNFLLKTVMVEVVAVTRDGREPIRQYNPWREVYVYGREADLSFLDDDSVYLNGFEVTY